MSDWETEAREIPDGLQTPELNDRLSVLRGFSVADHLDDRDIKAMFEAARGGIGDPTS